MKKLTRRTTQGWGKFGGMAEKFFFFGAEMGQGGAGRTTQCTHFATGSLTSARKERAGITSPQRQLDSVMYQ